MDNKAFILKIANPAFMWAVVFFGIATVFVVFGMLDKEEQNFMSIRIISQDSYLRFFVIPALLYWIYFFVSAISVHREAARSVAGVTRIISIGVYGKVRHPIYSADIILSWGIFFYLSSMLILACVLWLNFVLFFWMKLEEKLLLEKFGESYRSYMKDVPMFMPRIR